jgi:hypothetical protein
MSWICFVREENNSEQYGGMQESLEEYVMRLPSGWMPCSRQKSSQHALPSWIPACPTWTQIISLIPVLLPRATEQNKTKQTKTNSETNQPRFRKHAAEIRWGVLRVRERSKNAMAAKKLVRRFRQCFFCSFVFRTLAFFSRCWVVGVSHLFLPFLLLPPSQ